VATVLVTTAALACDGSSNPERPAPLKDCTILGLVVPANVEVGETRPLAACLEHCRPMYLPLDPDKVCGNHWIRRWRR
jgi:hypothetical protein